jgi:hypothetical protein
MTHRREIEPVLDRWLAEGPTRIADRVVFGALETVDHTEQLRVTRWLRRDNPMNQTRRLAIAAALAIVIGGGALLALALRSAPSTVGGPNQSPTSGPSAVPLYLPTMAKGVVYTVPPFTPAFTVTGADGWTLVAAAGPGTAWFANGPDADGPNGFGLGLIRPTQVLPVGGGDPQPMPSDLIAWFQGRSDLVLSAPTTAQVDGMPARAVEGTVAPAAKVNTGGNITLLCTVGECGFDSGNELAVAPDQHFEILVVDVRGQTVVIRMNAPASSWASSRHVLDDFLATITFPAN